MEDIDTEKDNDGEEKTEDGEKENEIEDVSQNDNISNPGEESDNSDNEDDESMKTSTEENKAVLDETETIKQENKESNDKPPEVVEKADNITKPKSKGNLKEENVNGKKKIREGKPFTKVVIRRLPPSMTKEVFLDQVSPLASYDYFYFVSASSVSPGGFSRAYINFINQNDLFDFTRTFDNYVFIDNKGHEYAAIVEFAPYQRVPKSRSGRKKDTLAGSLESDPVYLTFKEQLQAEALENSRTSNKQHYFETEISENEEIVTTPLLEYLKQRRAEKDRIREERREDRKRKDAERKLLKNKVKDKLTGGSTNAATITPSNQEDIEIKVLQAPKEKKDLNKEKDMKRTKTKDKEDRFIKPENRTREFKNKGGKSYREERLKQAEKREEKKKKENEESSKDTKEDPTATAVIEEELKDDDKYWNDKKKWKYGGSGDNKGGRTFTRRREEKKKEIYDRKKNVGKPYRTRKSSGECIEENQKKNDSTENQDKSTISSSTDKENTKKDKESIVKEESLKVKKENAWNTTSAQKNNKDDKENDRIKDVITSKESLKKESVASDSSNSKKDRLQKESSVDSEEGSKPAKDPRAERRIRNKDRPSIEIYRPGMGKFSRQRLEKEKTVGSTDESPSHSPSPTPNSTNNSK